MTELDALRGIAALVVFNSHYFGALAPSFVNLLRFTPVFCLMNGGAAVMLFFVLSGFVLTVKPLQRGEASAVVAPTILRWPRLAGPVVASAALYIIAARLGALPDASWLDRVGSAFPRGVLWGRNLDAGQFWSVLKEATFGTFIYGAAHHNIVLWTMAWELRGSVQSFILAACLLSKLRSTAKFVLFFAITIMSFMIWHGSHWLVGFPIGVAAAYFHLHSQRNLRISLPIAGLILTIASIVMTWDVGQPNRLWRWATCFDWDVRFYVWALTESFAALSIISTAIYCNQIRDLLKIAPAQFLGVFSFPLYLTHLLSILSFGAWICLRYRPNGIGTFGVLLLYLPTLFTSLAISIPVMIFDRWWLRRIGDVSRRLSRPKDLRVKQLNQ